jgi:glutaredoxin 3
MARVTMYVTGVCPYCHRAESLLRSKGLTEADLEIIRVDREPERRQEMMARSGRRTVPQIWVGGRHVGGCDDLHALEAQGGLDALLAQQQ